MTETPEKIAPVSTGSNWVHFLFSGILLLVSMVIYQSSQAAGMRKEISQFRHDNTALKESLAKSDHELQQAMTDFHTQLDQLKSELDTAHSEAGQARAVAVQHADALVSQLERDRRAEEQRQKQLTAELNQVKESTDETSTRLNGISNTVGTMTNEVESVRSVANQTSSGLQQTRGDLGVMSGLVATNADQIRALRDMGDRNVYEFTLTKTDGMRKVGGDVQLALEKTDAKKNRFTVQILAGDQKVEKSDRTVNEPVQFYVQGKGRHIYELVVNEIGKNSVKGYLATPKVALARNDAVTGN